MTDTAPPTTQTILDDFASWLIDRVTLHAKPRMVTNAE